MSRWNKIKNSPASAIEARAVGSGHYFTGKRCKNGHISKRRASDNKCLECDKGNAKRRRADPNLNVVINEQRKAWRENNQEKYQVVLADRRRAYQKSDRIKDRIYFNLWAKRGITKDAYAAMVKDQGGRCAICRKEEAAKRNGKAKRLAIDHCHKTGRVRGLLCESCNRGLGQTRDDPKILQAAIRYLKKHKK